MKFISLFSVVRGYNIPIIVLAQSLSAIFILAPEKRALSILLDFDLFIIVFASSLTIASGYIINNFYDSKKDLINRPNKSMLDRLVSQKTKLYVYFSLNFIVALLAIIVSWRAFLYFSTYIFLIWYYSHRIKKYPIIGNLTAAFLAILPFFAILLYYKNLYEVIFGHATFLFLLLLIREMIKDLENIKGDLANDYQTIPIVYGETIFEKNHHFFDHFDHHSGLCFDRNFRRGLYGHLFLQLPHRPDFLPAIPLEIHHQRAVHFAPQRPEIPDCGGRFLHHPHQPERVVARRKIVAFHLIVIARYEAIWSYFLLSTISLVANTATRGCRFHQG